MLNGFYFISAFSVVIFSKFRKLQNSLLQFLVLMTWSLMSIIKSLVSGKSWLIIIVIVVIMIIFLI